MRKMLNKLGKSIFSIFIMIAIAGGGIVFVMFVIAIIIGGETGNSLALLAKNTVMPLFIRCAAISMAGGLLNFYASGNHELTMDDY